MKLGETGYKGECRDTLDLALLGVMSQKTSKPNESALSYEKCMMVTATEEIYW